MLLETLDIKHNDVVIYSQNLFNLEKNFKIIYKDDPKKEAKKIIFNEVCRYINEFTPKNLIVYRLLTNIKDYEINISRYGYFLNINGQTELIFFDPVFAVKELEDQSENLNYYDLRFRIQQVGLTTLNRIGDKPNFAEIYCIDLEATEAKFQNDRIFAEAIFSVKKSAQKVKSAEKPEKNAVEKKLFKQVKELEEEDSSITIDLITKRKEPDLEQPYKIPEEPVKLPDKPAVEPKLTENNKKSAEEDLTEVSINKNIEESIQENLNIQDDSSTKNIKIKENILEPESRDIIEKDRSTIVYKVEDGIRIIQHDISEDKDFDYKQIMKINLKAAGKADFEIQKQGIDLNDNFLKKKPDEVFPKALKQDEVTKSSLGKFLMDSRNVKKEKKTDQTTPSAKESPVLNIFKTSSSLNDFVKGRENKQIVLKLNK